MHNVCKIFCIFAHIIDQVWHWGTQLTYCLQNVYNNNYTCISKRDNSSFSLVVNVYHCYGSCMRLSVTAQSKTTDDAIVLVACFQADKQYPVMIYLLSHCL